MAEKAFKPDEETKRQAEIFMQQLQSGAIKKTVLPNSAPTFNVNQASTSFDNFIASESFKQSLMNADE